MPDDNREPSKGFSQGSIMVRFAWCPQGGESIPGGQENKVKAKIKINGTGNW